MQSKYFDKVIYELLNVKFGYCWVNYLTQNTKHLIDNTSWNNIIQKPCPSQLDIVANGLAGFVDASLPDAVAEGEATAGMELRILGNSIRPFVFFEGMSDIMSLYWSGKLEEKASALRVIVKFLKPFNNMC